MLDEKRCGLPSGPEFATRCAFHAHVNRADPLSNSGIVFDYIEKRNREYLDLSKARFHGIPFDRDMLPTDVDIRFDNSEFEDCHFLELNIQKLMRFRECVFTRTPFDNIKVRAEGIDFTLATFTGQTVQFAHCDFRCTEGILFEQAHIECTTTPFRSCYFQAPKVVFNDCTFETDRLYVLVADQDHPGRDDRFLAIAAEQIWFVGIKLNGHFEYTNHPDCRDVSPIVLFSRVNFRQMKTATFTEANLKRARFTYSILHNVEFRNPKWERRGGRKMVYDEIEPVGKTGERHLRDTYIQLKRNYEEAHNYISAGHWFYREMECRRRSIAAKRTPALRWLRQSILSLTAWYRRISDYGENYKRPLWWIAFVWVAAALVYFYWIGYPTGSGLVSYEFSFEADGVAARDFLSALIFSGGIMLFQSVKLALAQPFPTPQLAFVQVVLTLILVPLFLLALRRKFRR